MANTEDVHGVLFQGEEYPVIADAETEGTGKVAVKQCSR